jgi:hypothetical protein
MLVSTDRKMNDITGISASSDVIEALMRPAGGLFPSILLGLMASYWHAVSCGRDVARADIQGRCHA